MGGAGYITVLCVHVLFSILSLVQLYFPVLFLVTGRCVDVDIGDKLLSLSRLFADDTSLGYTSQDEDQIKYVINHDLHELGDWSKR